MLQIKKIIFFNQDHCFANFLKYIFLCFPIKVYFNLTWNLKKKVYIFNFLKILTWTSIELIFDNKIRLPVLKERKQEWVYGKLNKQYKLEKKMYKVLF